MPDADPTFAALTRPPQPAPAQALESMLDAMRAHGGLPSVGHTLARLTRLLESDDDAVQVLADVILSDVALTQRLLKIANTIPYRAGPQSVTTVTRAIMLLGFDQVRLTAMSVVLVEGLLGDRVGDLRDEFHQSLLAGSLARELLAGREAEEAAIAAMFRSVGRMLVAVFAPQAHAAIRAACVNEKLTEHAAARRVLGKSYDELTEQMLREWRLPDRLISAVAPLPARIDSPGSAGERVRVTAQFAEGVAAALASQPIVRLDDVLARFAPAVAVTHEALLPMLERAGARNREFEAAFGLTPGPCPVAQFQNSVPGATRLDLDLPAIEPPAQRDALGRPHNACAILAAGLAEATDCLTRGARVDVNAVIQVTLESMFSGLGYARTALALRDPATGLYRTRAGFGTPKAQFGFATSGPPHLFTAALTQGKDLHIADCGSERLRASLPEWFTRDFTQAMSFLLMPLTVSDKVIGFFYADRPMPDATGLSAEELNLLRALRSQVVLAIRSR